MEKVIPFAQRQFGNDKIDEPAAVKIELLGIDQLGREMDIGAPILSYQHTHPAVLENPVQLAFIGHSNDQILSGSWIFELFIRAVIKCQSLDNNLPGAAAIFSLGESRVGGVRN